MAIRRPMKVKLPSKKPGGGSSKGSRGPVLKEAEEFRQAREAYLADDEVINNALSAMGIEERFEPKIASTIMQAFTEFMEGQHHKGSRNALRLKLASALGSYDAVDELIAQFAAELRLAESKIRGK